MCTGFRLRGNDNAVGRLKRSGAAKSAASLKTKIRQSLESGELCLLELEPAGLAGLAGKYESDPTLADICEEAYLARKAACPP